MFNSTARDLTIMRLPRSPLEGEVIRDVRGEGNCTVIAQNQRAIPTKVVPLDATCVQGLESDDLHTNTSGHTTSIVLATGSVATAFATQRLHGPRNFDAASSHLTSIGLWSIFAHISPVHSFHTDSTCIYSDLSTLPAPPTPLLHNTVQNMALQPWL